MVPFVPCEPFHEILYYISIVWSVLLVFACLVSWVRTSFVLFKIGSSSVAVDFPDCYDSCNLAVCSIKIRSVRLLGGMLGIFFVTALMYVWLVFTVYVPSWGTMDHAFHWRVYMLLAVLSTTVYVLWEFTTIIAGKRLCSLGKLANKKDILSSSF